VQKNNDGGVSVAGVADVRPQLGRVDLVGWSSQICGVQLCAGLAGPPQPSCDYCKRKRNSCVCDERERFSAAMTLVPLVPASAVRQRSMSGNDSVPQSDHIGWCGVHPFVAARQLQRLVHTGPVNPGLHPKRVSASRLRFRGLASGSLFRCVLLVGPDGTHARTRPKTSQEQPRKTS
jgi:hypothetical protein